MAEWQPIETAPKDGTEFLVWDGSRQDLVKWEAYGSWASIPGNWWCIARGESAHDGHVGDNQLLTVENPTHWMPLPAAPR